MSSVSSPATLRTFLCPVPAASLPVFPPPPLREIPWVKFSSLRSVSTWLDQVAFKGTQSSGVHVPLPSSPLSCLTPLPIPRTHLRWRELWGAYMRVPSWGIYDPLGISWHDEFQRECIQTPKLQNSFHIFFSEKIQGAYLSAAGGKATVRSSRRSLTFHGVYPCGDTSLLHPLICRSAH